MGIKFNPFTGKFDIVVDDHFLLRNIGTNTHVQIDSHIAKNYLNAHGNTATSAITVADTISSLNSNAYTFQFGSSVTDSAAAVGFSFDSNVTLSTYGSKVMSFRNGTTEVFFVDYQGRVSQPNMSSSTFFGTDSGKMEDFTDRKNTGFGYMAGMNLVTGHDNVLIGYYAGKTLYGGNYNTVVGSGAVDQAYNNTGISAFGYKCLEANGKNYNTGYGFYSLVFNSSGDGLAAFGRESGFYNNSGSKNSYFGEQSGYGNQSGSYNLCVGYRAGYGVAGTQSSYNVFLGPLAGSNVSGGGSNLLIGYNILLSTSNASNEFNIGNIITGDLSTLDLTFYGQTNLGPGTTTQAALNFANATSLKTTPVAGDMEFKDGHFYLTDGQRHVINTSAGPKTTTATVTNTTTETTIYSYNIAVGELHEDQMITFLMYGAVSNASASDDWTVRFKIGGTTVHTINRVGGNVTNQGWNAEYTATIRTTGASGTFVDFVKFDESTRYLAADVSTTHSIDTTTTNLFEVTVQWSLAKTGNIFACNQGVLKFYH